MNCQRRDIASRRGQTVVEFSLAIGLFLLVVGGIVQFGVILWSQNTINQIARDTARWAATQSTSPCDPTMRGPVAATANSLAQKWTLMDHEAWGSASTVSTVGIRGVGVDWTTVPEDPGGIETFPEDCPPSDNRIAWVVAVRINHTVPILIPGLQFIASGCDPGFCISSTAELRMEPKRPE